MYMNIIIYQITKSDFENVESLDKADSFTKTRIKRSTFNTQAFLECYLVINKKLKRNLLSKNSFYWIF